MGELSVYSLFSGSGGNSTYIRYESAELLIDAGCSARAIEKSLNALGSSLARISAIFITHEHSDHIRGLETISKKYGIPVYIPEQSLRFMKLNEAMEKAVIPVIIGEQIPLGALSVRSFRVPHDSVCCVGYHIEAGEHSLTCATDIGSLNHEIVSQFVSSEAVIIESNHDPDLLRSNPRYPAALKERILSDVGHLSNDIASRFAGYLAENGTKYIMLAHLSPDNNTPSLALRTLKEHIKDENVYCCCAAEHETVKLI